MRARLVLAVLTALSPTLAGALVGCGGEGEADPAFGGVAESESPVEPALPHTADATEDAEMMVITEVMHDDGGFPSINIRDYWDSGLPLKYWPVRIITTNQNGDSVGERIITEEMMIEGVTPDGEDYGGDLVVAAAMMREQMMSLKETKPEEFRQVVNGYRELLELAEREGDDEDRAALIAVLRGL